MQNSAAEKSLSVASAVVLVAAVGLSVPVVERFIAAWWQWYKFSGYSNDGYINLSLSTAWQFSGALAVIFGFSLWLYTRAKRHAATKAVAWSLWAMYVVIAVLGVYWLLGVSALNVWRA